MMKFASKRILAFLLVACLAAAIPISASSATTASGSWKDLSVTAAVAKYSQADLVAATAIDATTKITLQDNATVAQGTGVAINGNTVTISTAGTYHLTGKLTDGQVVIAAAKDDLVRLILANATIINAKGPAILAKQADKTIITLSANTVNNLGDGAAYSAAALADGLDAALYAQDDLTINGTGTLKITAKYKHGIASKDNLIIAEGVYDVAAPKSAWRGRDSIAIKSGTFTISAGSDAFVANNDEKEGKGWIVVDGGTFAITAANDAFQAETFLTINAGDFNLLTGGGSQLAPARQQDNVPTGERPLRGTATPGGLSMPRMTTTGAIQSPNGMTIPGNKVMQTQTKPKTETETETVSAKGLKAGSGLLIRGGKFTIDALDDAIHSNGGLQICGGIFSVKTGDDAIHADEFLRIDDGDINISQCYEGLESAKVVINGGSVRLTSADDGINAASDAPTAENYIRINGGEISLNVGGDGLDANGSVYFAGGKILVSGPASGPEVPLDYDQDCQITGGILTLAGSNGMFQMPGKASTQPSLGVFFSQTQSAATLLYLKDSSGNVVWAAAPTKDYQAILISSPRLQQSATYTLYSGGKALGSPVDGYYDSGTFTGGTVLTKVTLSEMATLINQDGSTATSQTGHMTNPGTMPGPGGRPFDPGGKLPFKATN
jgi:hypothetical protein